MIAAIEVRALAACRELVKCRAEVERISALIGNSLGACYDAWFHEQEKQHGHNFNYGAHEHHLKAAYAPIEYEYEDETCYRDEAAIVSMLAVCPHCTVAHKAIQERKAARRKLGAARRAITMIGRTAAAAEQVQEAS